MHKVKSIANNDQRQLVGQFGFFEEVFDALRVEAVRLATYALDFFDLACFACRLYIFEVHIGLLTEVDYGAEKVEEAFVGLERLEYVDERLGGQLLVVFDRDLHAHLFFYF